METEETLSIREELPEKEVIKIIKNTKGYNWEIKIYPIAINELDNSGKPTGRRLYQLFEADIERLKLLNEKMMREFGTLTE